MRAVLCRSWGNEAGLELAELESPKPAAGSVRVDVHVAGVNFADSLIVEGRYQHKPALPFIPGFELSGRIAEMGPGPNPLGFKVGDRVVGVMANGAFAEEVVLPFADIFKIPECIDYRTAAALPIAYGTSIGALEWRANLKQGEKLLVLGAGGGVGLAAVELGKSAGAKVIAAAGSDEKLALARRHGADHVVDYTRPGFHRTVKELTDGNGADVVIDPVGGSAFDESLRCTAWDGRIVVLGFAGGTITQVPANIVLVKNCAVLGFYWDSYRRRQPERVRASFEKLTRQFEGGQLRPEIAAELPLKDASPAISMLRDRKAAGKVVLSMGREPNS